MSFPRKLSDDEKSEIGTTLYSVGIKYVIDYLIDDSLLNFELSEKRHSDALALIPNKALPKSVPTRVRNLHEEDEDFWLDNRSLILTSYDFEKVVPFQQVLTKKIVVVSLMRKFLNQII